MVNKDSDIKNFIRENAFQLLGILAIVFNLWLTYKLVPISTGVQLNTIAVAALQNNQQDLATQAQVDDVIKRIDRLESKLDTYLFGQNQ